MHVYLYARVCLQLLHATVQCSVLSISSTMNVYIYMHAHLYDTRRVKWGERVAQRRIKRERECEQQRTACGIGSIQFTLYGQYASIRILLCTGPPPPNCNVRNGLHTSCAPKAKWSGRTLCIVVLMHDCRMPTILRTNVIRISRNV